MERPSSAAFSVSTPAAPTGITFIPTIGPIGTFLKITGANFTCASAVTVGASDTAVTALNVVSASEIRATVNTGTSTGLVKVTTPGNAAVPSAGTFTVNATAPVINSFSPTSGAVGTVINVIGQNFTNPPTVRINGVLASATFLSSTSLNVAVPSTTSGLITVTRRVAPQRVCERLHRDWVDDPDDHVVHPDDRYRRDERRHHRHEPHRSDPVRFNGVTRRTFIVNAPPPR